jgi:hypothetical protein
VNFHTVLLKILHGNFQYKNFINLKLNFNSFVCRRRNGKKQQPPITMKIKPEKYSNEPISLPFFDVDQVQQNSLLDDSGIDIDKLSSEAFRLSRTVHNFLNTHEPILSESQLKSQAERSNSFNKSSSCNDNKNDFLFALDDCQPSLRSTDESSVHSSSSSSEAHEDLAVLPKISSKNQHKIKAFSCHQTEDESGFSSMNSFHEIGLPLNSTFLSSSSADESHTTENIKQKRTTISKDNDKSLQKKNHSFTADHRRYDSVPISLNQSPKLKLLDDDGNSMKVLWV